MTRRSVVLIIAILLIVLVAVPWPHVRAQGDAGSGGDAGNTFETAYPINASAEYNGEIVGGDPEDWYSFPARAGQGIELVARDSFDSVAEIWDPFAVLRALGDDPPVASFLADSTGEWRSRIRPYSTGTGSYNFTVQLQPGRPQNDANSGRDAGNTFDAAILVLAGTHSGELAFGDSEDWYRIALEAGRRVEVLVRDTFDSIVGIYDPFRTAQGYGDNPPSVSFTAHAAGEWRIRIWSYGGAGGAYTVTVTLGPKLADIGLLWYIALGSFTAGGAALAAFAAFWRVPLSPKRPRYPMR